MKFVQLMTVPAFVFCMTAPSLASWPVLNCEVQQLRQGGHEAQNFRSIVTSEVRVSIKGPKFTAIDIEDQADDKLINCSFKVGYAERKDWSALNFRDVVEPSWKLFPTDSDSRKSGELRNLTTLIAAIDSLGLHAKRSSRERVSVDGKETYAIWNSIEVVVKADESEKIVKIVLAYMKSLNDKDKISVCQGEH